MYSDKTGYPVSESERLDEPGPSLRVGLVHHGRMIDVCLALGKFSWFILPR